MDIFSRYVHPHGVAMHCRRQFGTSLLPSVTRLGTSHVGNSFSSSSRHRKRVRMNTRWPVPHCQWFLQLSPFPQVLFCFGLQEKELATAVHYQLV